MTHKPLPDDWQVTFQEPQEFEGRQIPGFTQVDKLDPGAPDSRESTNIGELEREGYEPFSTRGLKTGRYRVRDLRQRGLVGVREAVDRLLNEDDTSLMPLSPHHPDPAEASAKTVIRCEGCGRQEEYAEARRAGWQAVKERPFRYRCVPCQPKG